MSSFETLHIINNLLIKGEENAAREIIIRLIDGLSDDEINYIRLPLNDLIRKVGLYPYIDRATANWQEKFLLEAFTVNVGDKEVVLHREQSKLLSGLLDGKNLAVSAPTSFGKSFIIDAYINLKKPKNIMIIVPTIALADEIRRRLQNKFKEDYKIITTTDIKLAEKNILILPQERALNYQDKIAEIDLLVIDEFYKASKNEKDTRSINLQRAMLEFQKIAKQRYYLAPNISDLTENIFTKGIEFISFDCKTVALNIEKTYSKINRNYSKTQAFIDVLNKVNGKTLVYVNSHASLNGLCTILFENEKNKNNIFLKDFADWIRRNYSSTWYLSFIIERGIATYNSNLHRSLTQIQLGIYESEMPLNVIVSTSSIIEGVNTCTKNIILWSNRISNSPLSFFTYRNIMGRTGRMFKYFVGEAFLLEKPPEEEAVVLDLELQEEASLLLNEDEFANELSSDELSRIINFKNKMADLLGVKYSELKNIHELDASESSNLQRIAYAILSNPSKFQNVNLLNAEYKYWEGQLNNIFYSIKPTNLGAKYSDILKVLLVIRNNWIKEIPEIITELENFDLNIDDFFKIERLISHNLANFLKSFEIIYNKRIFYKPININTFIEKISHSFLPKNVFYLEEFGLPRFISRKIHRSQLIDLENNEREVNDVINSFLEIGYDNLIQQVNDLDTFDKYVIDIFYKGIGG